MFLGTELIVGAAPDHRAGVASGMAQTSNELGGALGIALLGRLGTAVYRHDVAGAVGDHVPSGAASAARDTSPAPSTPPTSCRRVWSAPPTTRSRTACTSSPRGMRS
jgi:hypothetical protein